MRFLIRNSYLVKRLYLWYNFNTTNFTGKGKYGKRPPSFTTEYVAPFIDSEDSGFGCDFHSSESQLSWSNDEAAKLGANTNSTNSIQQPIFSLTSRSLSSSSNLSTSSQISTSSSISTSSGPPSSYSIPQFSTSSPEVSFLNFIMCTLCGNYDWCGCVVEYMCICTWIANCLFCFKKLQEH